MRRIPRPVPFVALAALSALLAPRASAQHGSLGPVRPLGASREDQ